MIVTLARRLAVALLSRIRTGTLIVVDGSVHRSFGSGSPVARVRLHSPRVWPMLLRGSTGLADAYAEGLWDSPDLVSVIRLAARNAPQLDRMARRFAAIVRPVQVTRAALVRGTRARNRKEIAAHYDLGNRLFAQMLDPTMTYSSALFDRDEMTLEEAQVAKLDRICDRLDLGPGDRVLEIGSGWGSFAVHAASTRGCHVTTTTISGEQHDHVLALTRAAGLEDKITVLRQDYRDLSGRFDKLVSIEMIEAVGWRNFGRFFAKCSELLSPNGSMLLQAITIDDRAYGVEKASRSFINTRIFPGGCLPSLEVITRHTARRTDLQAVGLDDLTADYVQTLRQWRERFSAAAGPLAEIGYDERFARLWTLYLAYCEAGFAERRISCVQLLLAKPRWRAASRVRTARSGKSSTDVHQLELSG